MYTIKSNGIKFNIIVTINEIMYSDSNGGTLTWIRNDYNQVLVNNMIKELTQ